MEQESATTEKQHLEKRLQDESLGLHTSYSDLEVSQLKAEIEVCASFFASSRIL
jgi:stromal interaction molecule 1